MNACKHVRMRVLVCKTEKTFILWLARRINHWREFVWSFRRIVSHVNSHLLMNNTIKLLRVNVYLYFFSIWYFVVFVFVKMLHWSVRARFPNTRKEINSNTYVGQICNVYLKKDIFWSARNNFSVKNTFLFEKIL